MGHSIGISDSYYRITEEEILEDYLNAIPMLTLSSKYRLQNDMENISKQSKDSVTNIQSQLHEKEKAIAILTENNSNNKEAIASLSDQLDKLMEEIDMLKKGKGEN
jgi:hypothetical protein